MKNFDRRMRQKAQGENWQLKQDAQERLGEALDRARMQPSKPSRDRASAMGWKLAALPWAVVGVIMLLLIPRQDVTDQGLAPQPAQQEISAAMQPAAQYARKPDVWFEASYINEEVRVDASFRNDTQDIWIVEWNAKLQDDDAAAGSLIWLEPGAECEDAIIWQTSEDAVDVEWQHACWRVTAKVLHWVEGDVLTPGQDGYEDQQSLMKDAMEAGALILAPEEWANGEAGRMRLPMPKGYEKENILQYYFETGALEKPDEGLKRTENARFVKKVHNSENISILQTVEK